MITLIVLSVILVLILETIAENFVSLVLFVVIVAIMLAAATATNSQKQLKGINLKVEILRAKAAAKQLSSTGTWYCALFAEPQLTIETTMENTAIKALFAVVV